MAASRSQRVFAFVLAMLFLISTIIISVFFLWDYFSEDDAVNDVTVSQNDEDNQDNQTNQESEQTQEVQKLENFTGPVAVPELRWEVLEEGEGAVVSEGDTITIHYTGALASDGTVFDSSVARGQTATFPLDNLIEGWKQGIPGMKVGETRRLFIPAELGYGVAPEGYEYTPGGSPLGDLVFDIELFDTTSSQ